MFLYRTRVLVTALMTSLVLTLSTANANNAPTNKQLVVGITQEFESLNPIISTMLASSYIYNLSGRALVALDVDWNWQCHLCTEIPTLENGRARIVEIDGVKKVQADWEIKKEAVWGDGTPITGHDVKLSWEIGSAPTVTVGSKEQYTMIESVTIDEKDPKKFTLLFEEARYDHFQLGRFYIVPAHIEGPIFEKTKDQANAYEQQTAFTTDSTNPALSSGPYRISELRLGSHVIFERNPKWWGTKANIERIIFRLIPNTQTLEANLLSGTIDMISELGLSFDQALAFEKRIASNKNLQERFKLLFQDGMTYEHIDLNLRNPILQDVNVRRALMHAINLDELVEALFEERQSVALHNIHPRDPYYTDNVIKHEYSQEIANKLLEDAGWKKRRDGFRYKDNERLQFTLMTTAENRTRELIQVWLQAEWKKVGIDIRIRNEPPRVYFGETVRRGAYDHMAMFAWISAPDAPPRSTLHSDQIPTEANNYSGQNSGGYANEEVDKLLDAIRTEFSFEKRKEMMHKVQWHYTNDVPVLPLYLRADIAAIPANMTGFQITGHMYSSTMSVEYWSLEPRRVAKK